MGIARNHHTLPAFYLKRFADENGLLSKWDKAAKKWGPIRPKSASVEVDFYIVETEEGPSDAIENALSVIEGRAAEVIQTIDAGTWPIAIERKAQLAEFLSLQRVRGTGFRASVNRFTDQITDKMYYLEEMASYQRQFLAANGRQPNDDELREHSRTIERPVQVSMSQNAAIEMMLKLAADDLRLAIYTYRSWNLERATGAPYVTADSPLSLWSSNPPGFWGEGEATVDEIAFPLDPRTCLVMRHPDTGESVTDVDSDRVRELNDRTFDHAHKLVFARPGSEGQVLEP
ncbi:MAG: DUF4238 domain-containing protein [Actinomycetota bacterium]